jgi:MFS transporter, MHS family, citrate/tricarballylate:H+ symporter
MRIGVLAFFMIVSATVGAYGLGYLTVYPQTTLGMATELAFGATIFYGLAAMIFDLVGGVASDRFGRKPVMLLGAGALALTLVPCFLWLNTSPTLFVLGTVSFWLSIWNALGPAAALTAVTEALPMVHRSTALALTYSLAVVVFGGSTQVVVAWLTDITGNPLAPAYYVLAGTLISVGAMIVFPETAPAVLRVKDNQVRLGFDAPPNVAVHREEIYERLNGKQNSADGR